MELLDTALILGISEFDFWNMTEAEVKRAAKAHLNQQKLRARFDYRQAGFIISGFNGKFLDIWEVYPDLFNSEEEIAKREQREAELSALRFINFAESFNKRFVEDTK